MLALTEAIKNIRQELGADALSGIANDNQNIFVITNQSQIDAAAQSVAATAT